MTSDSVAETQKEDIQPAGTKQESVNLKFGAVVRAFLANLFITTIKFASWWLTKSSAMFAEAVHSGVDSFNSICLMVGLKRGSRPADGVHPFGHGLETNVWTIVACLLMFIGAVVSLISSYNKLVTPTE